MQAIKLTKEDIKSINLNLKKVIGQLQSLHTVIEENSVTDQTFTQLLASKGGVSRVCKEIISRGVLKNIHKYSHEELSKALDIIFKLDK